MPPRCRMPSTLPLGLARNNASPRRWYSAISSSSSATPVTSTRRRVLDQEGCGPLSGRRGLGGKRRGGKQQGDSGSAERLSVSPAHSLNETGVMSKTTTRSGTPPACRT